jgi:hypothetical protein
MRLTALSVALVLLTACGAAPGATTTDDQATPTTIAAAQLSSTQTPVAATTLTAGTQPTVVALPTRTQSLAPSATAIPLASATSAPTSTPPAVRVSTTLTPTPSRKGATIDTATPAGTWVQVEPQAEIRVTDLRTVDRYVTRSSTIVPKQDGDKVFVLTLEGRYLVTILEDISCSVCDTRASQRRA